MACSAPLYHAANHLKTRRVSSIFHLGIVWGFTFYFLVNVLDGLRGFIPDFDKTLQSTGILFDIYNLIGDLLSVAVLVGMSYFLLRRLCCPPKSNCNITKMFSCTLT